MINHTQGNELFWGMRNPYIAMRGVCLTQVAVTTSSHYMSTVCITSAEQAKWCPPVIVRTGTASTAGQEEKAHTTAAVQLVAEACWRPEHITGVRLTHALGKRPLGKRP